MSSLKRKFIRLMCYLFRRKPKSILGGKIFHLWPKPTQSQSCQDYCCEYQFLIEHKDPNSPSFYIIHLCEPPSTDVAMTSFYGAVRNMMPAALGARFVLDDIDDKIIRLPADVETDSADPSMWTLSFYPPRKKDDVA
ncbi:MAG: hypothetical protein V4576_02240 [Patescibacteria group bacterium]